MNIIMIEYLVIKRFLMPTTLQGLFLFACILVLSIPHANADQDKYDLTVNVTGASENKGQVILSVFDSEESFLQLPVVSKTHKVDADGKASFTLQQLQSGTYAVSVVYDADNNGELNTGFLGIPTELVGFSNDAKGIFGPPSFEDAAFELDHTLTLNIKLGIADLSEDNIADNEED